MNLRPPAGKANLDRPFYGVQACVMGWGILIAVAPYQYKIGTAASGAFLYLIGAVNLVVLIGIGRTFLAMRRGECDERRLEHHLAGRGLVNRLLRRVGGVDKPWQMYPIGLGFDFAYEGAFAKPVRKVYYNITVTALSVAVALFIGTIELLSIVADRFHLVGGLWDWISGSGPESNRIRRGRVVRADLAGRAGDLVVRPDRAVVGGRGLTPAGIDGRRVPPGARRLSRRGGWRWVLWRRASSTLITPIG